MDPGGVRLGGFSLHRRVCCGFDSPDQGAEYFKEIARSSSRISCWQIPDGVGLRYIEEVPTMAVRFSSFNQVLLSSYGYRQTLRRAVCPRAAAARPPRKDFYLKMGQSGCSEEEIGQSMERLAAAVERMNTALAAAGPWLISVDYVDSTSPRSPAGSAGW
jgi:hypothetical protein